MAIGVLTELAKFAKDLISLLGPTGAAKLGFTLNTPGALPRKLSDKLNERVSVKDYGAIGDGTLHTVVEWYTPSSPHYRGYANLAAVQVDFPFVTLTTDSIDWAAFRRAAMNHSYVGVPAGEYWLTGNVPTGTCFIECDAGFTKIVFINGTDGFSFTPTGFATQSGIVDAAILAKGANGGIAIQTPNDPLQYYDLKSRFVFHNLTIGGYTPLPPGVAAGHERVEGWLLGIWQRQSFNAQITNVDVLGNYNIYLADTGQALTVGFKFGETGMDGVSASIYCDHCTIASTRRAVEFSGGTFWRIHDSDFAHNFDGIFQVDTMGASECKITETNLNAQHFGLYAYGPTTITIAGLTVRRHSKGIVDQPHDWKGIHIITGAKVTMGRLEIQPSIKTAAGYTSRGIHLVGVSAPMIDMATFGQFMDEAMYFDNCLQVHTDKISASNAINQGAQAYVYKLVNNTRSCNFGTLSLSTSFTGEVIDYSDPTIGAGAFKFLYRTLDLEASAPHLSFIRRGAPVNQSIWDISSGMSQFNIQAKDDNGSNGVNALILTRSGTTVTQMDLRASRIKINAGPDIITGSGSPEGVHTATPGSEYWNTAGGANVTKWVKETGTGNTGWIAK